MRGGAFLQTGSNYQMAGNQSGSGAMAAALLGGSVRLGIGQAHGWDPVGSQLRISRSRGFWLRALNGRPASEAYAELFGHPAQDWSFPPLSYLARLYPLGLPQGDELLIRAPIRVEADGSFRMNAPLRDGADAYLLVGSRAACLRAAGKAAQDAVRALGDAQPVFGLVLVDAAWQLLLESSPGADVAAVSDIMGPKVPVAGAYTLGQIVPSPNPTGPRAAAPVPESAYRSCRVWRGNNLTAAPTLLQRRAPFLPPARSHAQAGAQTAQSTNPEPMCNIDKPADD